MHVYRRSNALNFKDSRDHSANLHLVSYEKEIKLEGLEF